MIIYIHKKIKVIREKKWGMNNEEKKKNIEFMYMLDDAIIFTIALVTLSSIKLTKKKGKILKFISGFMMLVLGLILIIKPELLMFG